MPSLIGAQLGGGATGTVAQNYRQQIVPFSRFGTRKIAFFRIGRADDQQSGGVLDMVLFNKLIEGIQTKAELVLVGAPYISNSWGKFVVGVFADTFADGNNNLETEAGYNGMAETLQDTLRAIANDGDINVRRIYMYGAPETNHTGYDGWTEDSDYQEWNTKAEQVANSYIY